MLTALSILFYALTAFFSNVGGFFHQEARATGGADDTGAAHVCEIIAVILFVLASILQVMS